ncbi:hypothetical protein V5799_032620, partial [Amblyomma americanum]
PCSCRGNDTSDHAIAPIFGERAVQASRLREHHCKEITAAYDAYLGDVTYYSAGVAGLLIKARRKSCGAHFGSSGDTSTFLLNLWFQFAVPCSCRGNDTSDHAIAPIFGERAVQASRLREHHYKEITAAYDAYLGDVTYYSAGVAGLLIKARRKSCGAHFGSSGDTSTFLLNLWFQFAVPCSCRGNDTSDHAIAPIFGERAVQASRLREHHYKEITAAYDAYLGDVTYYSAGVAGLLIKARRKSCGAHFGSSGDTSTFLLNLWFQFAVPCSCRGNDTSDHAIAPIFRERAVQASRLREHHYKEITAAYDAYLGDVTYYSAGVAGLLIKARRKSCGAHFGSSGDTSTFLLNLWFQFAVPCSCRGNDTSDHAIAPIFRERAVQASRLREHHYKEITAAYDAYLGDVTYYSAGVAGLLIKARRKSCGAHFGSSGDTSTFLLNLWFQFAVPCSCRGNDTSDHAIAPIFRERAVQASRLREHHYKEITAAYDAYLGDVTYYSAGVAGLLIKARRKSCGAHFGSSGDTSTFLLNLWFQFA